MKNVVITGGGTGGHLFASIAFAEYAESLGYSPFIIGSIYGMEKEKLKNYPYRYKLLKTKGFAGKSLQEKLKSLYGVGLSIVDTVRLIIKIKPVFSIGFGGYTTVPVILSSKMLGIKTAIAEQNSIAGRANKFLSKFSDVVFVNFKETASQFKNHKRVIHSGNPLRKDIVIKERNFNKDRLTIGVIGGSRGAKSINKAMMEFAEKTDLNLNVIHQTGKEDYKNVEKIYKQKKPGWKAVTFIDNMKRFYEKIDFIICRAGASTLSEIACARLGSLLIPYPYAIYNHQHHNAEVFVKRGAAMLVKDENLSGKKIESIILSLNQNKLRLLSDNANSLCVANACEKIFETIQKL